MVCLTFRAINNYFGNHFHYYKIGTFKTEFVVALYDGIEYSLFIFAESVKLSCLTDRSATIQNKKMKPMIIFIDNHNYVRISNKRFEKV